MEPGAQRAQEQKAKEQEDAKNSILSQLLDQNARARRKYPAHQRGESEAWGLLQ